MTPRGLVGTLIVVIVAIACVRLGFWQLERRQQRAVRNAGVEARMSEPPVEVTGAPDDTAGWLYRRVRISGVPDAARAIVLPGRLHRGTPGAHVLVPVPLPGGEAVLVDFGWAPSPDGATLDLAVMAIDDPVDATALVLPFPGDEPGARPPSAAAASRNPTFRRVWYSMDGEALRAQFPYDLGSVRLQLLPSEAAASPPVRLEAPALDPGPHLGYAIQWFSFAGIAIIGWLVMVTKSRTHRAVQPRTGAP